MRGLDRLFEKIALRVSKVVGSHKWFIFSLLIVLLWLPSGFFIGFEEIWHLWISTITTILTFLMMSLLHASQSKWEKRMEQMEMRQEKMLKLLEKQTEEITKDIKSTTTPIQTLQ